MSQWSPPDTAALHLDALYERDIDGLLSRSRDPDVPPPHFHLFRTPQGNRWLLSAALSDEMRSALDALLAAEPVVSGVEVMEHHLPVGREAILSLLASNQPSAFESRGPAFTFPTVLPRSSTVVKELIDPRRVNVHPELAWLGGASQAIRPIVVARNEAGDVVAACHSARLTDRAAEAGVETATEERRRGLGSAVVIGWASAILRGGRAPLYSTTWGNIASRAIARKLALVPYGEDWHVG